MGNREIKFRVWDSQFNKFLKLDGSVLMHPESGNLHGSRSGGNVETWHLQQYTGLKDANGVEIYEGDVINWHGAVCYIAWEESDASFMAVEQYESWAESGQEWGGNCEVIGNIYQNPELLK